MQATPLKLGFPLDSRYSPLYCVLLCSPLHFPHISITFSLTFPLHFMAILVQSLARLVLLGSGCLRHSTVPSYLSSPQIYNTKPSSVDITVVCLLPRASDDKIDVQLIQPPKESLFKGTTDAVSELGNSATGEGQLASGSVMQNKITNNIVFSRTLKAQEKVNLPFSYSMQWPPEAGNEVQIC